MIRKLRRAGLLAVAGAGLGCGDGAVGRDPDLSLWEARSSTPASARAANRAPEVRLLRIEPVAPVEGQQVRAVVHAVDPDGDPVSLEFRWTVQERLRPESGGEITLGSVVRGDPIEVEVVVSDGGSESPPVRTATRVGNRRPVLRALRVEPGPEVGVGAAVRVVAEAADPDGDHVELRYSWRVNGIPVEAAGPEFSTRGLKRGDRLQARVVGNDGDSRSDPLESAVVRIADMPPEIRSALVPGVHGGLFRHRVPAVDPEGGPLWYRLRQAPAGMVIDATEGEITWRPGSDQIGVHPVAVAVRDAGGSVTVQEFELRVDGAESTGFPASPAP